MKFNSIYIAVSITLTCLSIKAQTPDPGLVGPHTVIKAQYNLGDLAFSTPSFPVAIEVRGSVHYPSDLVNGPYPVIMYLHGRHETCFTTASPGSTALAWPCAPGDESITSYEGYDYSASQLASHGYIVISISANAINATDNSTGDYGMAARGELMQHHFDLWNTWNTVDSIAPFDSLFNGALDLSRVGTMGHSRGGEGAIRNALLNASLGSPYGIKAVLTLAPVDFDRYVMNDIPLLNVSPYCDGDVSDLQGVHFYDDARYNLTTDEAPKHNLLMLGANHNFYNTVWTPGLYPAGGSDDWDDFYGSTSDFCGTAGAGTKRMTPALQQSSYMAYASAFFRTYVGGDTTFIPLLEADDIIPPASSTLDSTEAFMSFQAPISKRLDFNRTFTETAEITNELGGSATGFSLLRYDICADDAGETDCSVDTWFDKEPHASSGPLGMPQLAIEWDNATDYYENIIPAAYMDVSQYKDLQFRVGVNFADAPSGVSTNFSVQLMDTVGNISTQDVSNHTNALYYPPGYQLWELPKVVFNTVKIPLLDFTGVNLEEIESIKFLFDKTSASSILITDFTFSGDAPPPVSTVGVNETSLLPIQIYPNPTNGSITVNLGKNKNIQGISLYDIQGKNLYQVKNVSDVLMIDLINFDRGIYILTVQGENDSRNYKVVRQ
jgi:Secretion system C-terminal sorting domain